MRQPRLTVALFLLGSAMSWAAAAETPPVTDVAPSAPTTVRLPDVQASEWMKALRRNDLSGAFALLSNPGQSRLAHQWQRQAVRADAYVDVQIDTVLRLVQNPMAVDQVMAMSQPYLALIDVPAMTKAINDITGLLAMAADSSGGLDHAGLRNWLLDLVKWLPTAGLADQAKAKLAAGHLVKAITASGLKSAAELRGMALPDLLARLGPALPALKDALAVYDVGVDRFLDSFTAKLGDDVTPEQATLALGFTSLGKPRTITLKLVQKDGAWQLSEGNDNSLTGLSQLVMMTLLMQGMGVSAPAQPPPAAPADDGAL
ncbi:MAG TPA: hypothetical protein VHX44_07105 [Planctomycetota bacterium]|nr:hypothetical protein [Planctomycetota bacterium]